MRVHMDVGCGMLYDDVDVDVDDVDALPHGHAWMCDGMDGSYAMSFARCVTVCVPVCSWNPYPQVNQDPHAAETQYIQSWVRATREHGQERKHESRWQHMDDIVEYVVINVYACDVPTCAYVFRCSGLVPIRSHRLLALLPLPDIHLLLQYIIYGASGSTLR